ncbi:MAG: FecR domain-containing protein [Cytophagales bacterium]|jgi:ferric-dicitrate binding protein FerR (iron transport regulator)|nr:FecR domain-containing protein [Cytophagales bacterium]
MADYLNYSIEDFVADADFREWVLHPTPASERFWRAFQKEHPQQAAIVQQARTVVLSVRMDWREVSDEEAQQSYRRLQSRLQEQEQPARVRRLMPYKSIAVAATVIGILFVAGWWYVQSVSKVLVQTAFGETKTVQLPDGSTVLLNANSSLAYQNNWQGQEQRTVQLTGEAYFKVSHQEIQTSSGTAAVKFVVQADDVNVEVVGTEFTVKNRHESTRVSLYKGKVRLQSARNRQPVLMQPGETAEFDKMQGQITLRSKPAETAWAWEQNKLVFKEATLREVAQTLQDNYGLTVEFEQDSLEKMQFTGDVSNGKVNVLITAIAESFDCKVRQEDKKVIFYK